MRQITSQADLVQLSGYYQYQPKIKMTINFSMELKTNSMTEEKLASAWLIAYTESIAQKRRNIAPIDEPFQQWLATLKGILEDVISI